MLRFGLFMVAWLLLLATPALAQGTAAVTVESVTDGDTIKVRPAVQGTDDVRLIGVDTPETVDPGEPVQPFGPQASAFTERSLEGERVTLLFDREREDPFDRALAYVRLGGSDETFNETLLQGGYAQLYVVPPNDRFEVQFRQAQDRARRAERGIWGLPKPQQCELTDRGNGIGEGSPGCGRPQQPSRPQSPSRPRPPAGDDRDCADFRSRVEAQAALDAVPNDPDRLDADADGEACEVFDYAPDTPGPTDLGTPRTELPDTGGTPLPRALAAALAFGALLAAVVRMR